MVQLNLPALRSFLWGSKVNDALNALNDAKTEAADVQAIAETVAEDKFNKIVVAPNDAVVSTLVQDSGSATAAALNSTFLAESTTAFGATPLTDVEIIEIADGGVVPIGVLADGLLYGATATHIHSSADSGTTWTQLSAHNTVVGGTPRRIFPLPSGEVLVVKQNTLVTSTGWNVNPATATWSVRLNLLPRATNFDAWSVDCKGNKIIATDYGLYASQPWRVWVSTDGGTTFTLSLDLGAIYTPGQLAGTHMHGVAYDEYRDTFWAANGDDAGAAQVWWSDDDGATWNPIANPIGKERHTALMPMPDGILLGTDAGSNIALNGVYRIRPDDYEDIALSYEAQVGFGGLTHVAYSTQVGSDGIGYMTFGPWQTVGIPSVMVASVDGRSVQEIWRDPNPVTGDVAQRQLVLAVGPDLNGKIVGHLSSTTTGEGWRLVASAPRRGGPVAERVDLGRAGGGRAINQTSMAVSPSAIASTNNSVAVGPGARAGTGSPTSNQNTAIGQGAQAGAETGVFQSGTESPRVRWRLSTHGG